MRLGLLSTARINDAVLGGAAHSDAVEVVAVASRDEGRARAYAQEHGLARAHGSYEALLADPEVDAVYVSLPNADHVPWSVRALEAGKHVLCEKPLTRHPEEAEAAFAAAERAGRVLMEAFMWRHLPQTARLVELVREGAIGPVRLVRSAFSFTLPAGANVRLEPELDGGALMDVGCYCVSALRLLAGEPERVAGEQALGPTGVDVRFAGVARFPGDVVGHFDCGFDVPPRRGIEVVGADGLLWVPDPWRAQEPLIELHRDGAVEAIRAPEADPYRLELEDLARAAAGDGEPLLGARDAIGQARVLEALHRAAREGAAVSV